MSIGQEDHRGIAVPPAVSAGGFDQLIDLLRNQVLPGPKLGVGATAWRNCSIYGGWGDQPQLYTNSLHLKTIGCGENCREKRNAVDFRPIVRVRRQPPHGSVWADPLSGAPHAGCWPRLMPSLCLGVQNLVVEGQ